MGRGSSSLDRLRIGFLQEIGRRLRRLSTPPYQRQHSTGRKHDLLWVLTFHFRESDLGWHSCFFDCSQKAPCFSLDPYDNFGQRIRDLFRAGLKPKQKLSKKWTP